VQLVTGCHNIEGRSRTCQCSEYKDDFRIFLLALNAFGCLLLALDAIVCCQLWLNMHVCCVCSSPVRLLVEDDSAWHRLCAPPCRRRLFLGVFVGFGRVLCPPGRRAGCCCLARRSVDDSRAALAVASESTPAAVAAEACTPPSFEQFSVLPEIVRSRATDARVDCVINHT
jgi:hypothetical protein